MSAEEQDYSSLPLDERLVHKVWKVRLEAYEELTEQFKSSRSEADACFQDYNQRPELMKTFITDSNVVAQEAGLNLLVNYLQYGGTATNTARLKGAGIVTAICEKGLSSSRKNTKSYATEALLLLVEISKEPNSIIEDITPSFTNRLPKLVAGSVGAVKEIVANFGCQTISPKVIIPSLAKLFAHADKNVRAETTQLTVELYKWMRESLVTVLFADLKPVQQKDLTKAFEAVQDIPAEQTRFTRKQQLEIQRLEEMKASASTSTAIDGDVEMDAEENIATPADDFNPYDLADPVEVLSKFPEDLDTRINSAKWKDRKEVLEEVFEILKNVVKLVTNDDYTPFFRIVAKCMKDANVQVVEIAANCSEIVTKGLQKSSQKYRPIILGPMIERTKEKKASVATALANALDAIFAVSSLSDVLEETINGMKLKTPQNKIAAANYLQRCLAATKIPPKTSEVDSIMEIGVKLLSESQEPIRQASTEVIGTLMKITGERELKQFLEKIDANRKTKIISYFETVQVQSTKSAPQQSAPASKAAAKAPAAVRKQATSTIRKPSISSSSIPSKRLATSPVKRADDAPKVSTYGRGLTTRSLASNPTPSVQPPSVSTRAAPELSLSPEEKAELQQLRREKQLWLESKAREAQKYSQLEAENNSLRIELAQNRSSAESFHREHTNSVLMIQQKETQIGRLHSDLEDAKQKIRLLEQEIEMMKLLQTTAAQSKQSYSGFYSASHSPYEGANNGVGTPEQQLTRITSGELSSGVKRLSIGNDTYKENPYIKPTSSFNSRMDSPQRMSTITNTAKDSSDFDSSDDWKRAAEVTSQLKARIEKMKARSRITPSHIG
ncbi:armadillo-type protein [Scheffersomyces xylosifermentans]|uniref:armadillo-type protein n=1 Tax=Scheffersomyces xylosifermentans TaxID=1304137 RepID=UPI00315CD340